MSPVSIAKRGLIFVHRWLGTAVASVMTLWFLSGIVMLYWSYPAIGSFDYLERAPILDPSRIRLSAAEAFPGASTDRPAYITLASFDGRPVYLGGRMVIYADDGSEQRTIDQAMVDRAAAAWSGRPLADAKRDSVRKADLWTLGDGLRNLRPLYRYSWPDGQQVYVSGTTAAVVQYTTPASRFWAYLGAIPHWLYVPALRSQDRRWLAIMVWASIGVVAAGVVGIAIALWMYSPRRRYRYAGSPAALPYTGWKRWHTVMGLSFGFVTATWAFSGLVSLEPFGIEDRLTALTAAPTTDGDDEALQSWLRMGKLLLDRPIELSAYSAKHPRDVPASIPGFDVREIEFASIEGEAVYLATNGRGQTMIVPVRGEPRATFDAEALMRRMREVGGRQVDELALLTTYDAYYRDRTGRMPLPVIYARMKDSTASRYYVDPKTASLVGSYSSREWVGRWLHHGLHSLDFPWLYNRRPLWDIVILTLLVSGTALCATSLVLTYRVIARKAARAMTRFFPAGEPPTFEVDRAGVD